MIGANRLISVQKKYWICLLRPNSNNVQLDNNETLSQKSSKAIDDLDLIDIESLFDEDTDDRPVLSQEEAWELFA